MDSSRQSRSGVLPGEPTFPRKKADRLKDGLSHCSTSKCWASLWLHRLIRPPVAGHAVVMGMRSGNEMRVSFGSNFVIGGIVSDGCNAPFPCSALFDSVAPEFIDGLLCRIKHQRPFPRCLLVADCVHPRGDLLQLYLASLQRESQRPPR
jgi:hypothetical protein